MGIFILCLAEEEIHEVMDEFYNCLCDRHYSWRAISQKILKANFYWSKLFGEVHSYVWAYEKCQRFVEKYKLAPFPLILVSIEHPFKQWEL